MRRHSFRVLFLIENVPYALDTRVRRESHALMSAGGEITVICPSDGSGAVRDIDGVRVYQYPKPSLGAGFLAHVCEYVVSLFFHTLLTAWVALRHGFDVIHVANPPDLLWIVAAPYRLLGKRFVFDHHDLVPELFEVRYRDRVPGVMAVVLWLERMSLRLADHVICTNDTFRHFAMTRGGRRGEDVTVVRNGPWLGRDFPQVRAGRADGLAPPRKCLVGYLGIMNPQDHIDHLVRAADIVRHELRRDDIEFLLIGSGDAHESLRALRDSLGLADAVQMPGTLPWREVIERLTGTDVCVQPDPPTPFNRPPHHEQAHGIHGARQAGHRLRHAGDTFQRWRCRDVHRGSHSGGSGGGDRAAGRRRAAARRDGAAGARAHRKRPELGTPAVGIVRRVPAPPSHAPQPRAAALLNPMPFVTVVAGRIHAQKLEYNLVDHCNLSCRECSHLSPFLRAHALPLETFRRDLTRLAEVYRVQRLRFVGGEPLLHDDICAFVDAARASGIATHIEVVSNGTLLARVSDQLLESIDSLALSLYPGKHPDEAMMADHSRTLPQVRRATSPGIHRSLPQDADGAAHRGSAAARRRVQVLSHRTRLVLPDHLRRPFLPVLASALHRCLSRKGGS